MGELIEWDFYANEPAPQPRERDVVSLLEDYHEAVRQGGVAFDEIDAEFVEFARKVGGR